MAIGRGESVGEAYIRIHADGSGLPREIKDQFEEELSQFEDHGRERGEIEEQAYNDARKEQRDKNHKVTQREIEQQLKRDSGRREALETFLAGREGKAIRNQLRKDLSRGGKSGGRELADRIFTDIAEQARRRGGTKIFSDLFGSYKATFKPQADDESDADFAKRQAEYRRAEIAHSKRQSLLLAAFRRKATEDIRRDQREQERIEDVAAKARQQRLDNLKGSIERHFADRDKTEQDYLRDHVRALRDNDRFDEAAVRRQTAFQRKLLLLDRQKVKAQNGVFAGQVYHNRRRAIAERDEFNARYALARKDAQRTGDVSLLNRLIAERTKLFNDYNNKLVRNNGLLRGGERATTELERSLNRTKARYDELLDDKFSRRGGIIARTFKSIGRSIVDNTGGRVLRSVLNLGRGYGNVMGILRSDSSRGRKGLDLLNLGFTSVTNGLKRFVLSVARGLLKLTAFYLIAGPIAALLSMLAGAIVALSSTIIVGLVGAVGAALPALATLGVAVGVIGLAFAKMSKETKAALKIKLAPLAKELNVLRETARSGILSELDTQVPKVAALMQSLRPLVDGVAKALARTGTTFLDGLNSPDAKASIKVFSTEMPTALMKLGGIFTDVFVGALNYIRALFPAAQRLLDTFGGGAKKFREFTASAAGQNKIKTYMDGAWESAKILGTTLKLTYRVLRDLTNAGKGTGDTLFGNINKNLQKYDEYLTSSRGRKEVQGFFDDVEKFMGSLGRFTGGIARLFGSLDDQTSRGSLNTILDLVGDLADVIGDAMPIISAFSRALGEALSELKGPIKDLLSAMRPIIQAVAGDISKIMVVAVKALVLVLDPLVTALAGVARFISDHKEIFRPLIVGLLLLKGAFVLNSIGTLIAGRIASAVAAIQLASTTGAGTLRTAAGRLGRGVAGIGLALGGIALGNSVGGNKGVAISTLGGAAGGALAGSAFGPIGAAIGGTIGGIAGFVSGLSSKYEEAGRVGQEAARKAAEARRAEREEIQGAISDLQSLGGEYGKEYKLGVARTLNNASGAVPNALGKNAANTSGKYGKDALTRANNAGIDPQLAVNSALGDTNSFAKLRAQLDALQAKNGGSSDSGSSIKMSAKDTQQLKAYEELYNLVITKQPGLAKAEQGFQALRKAIGENVTNVSLLEGGVKNLGKELQGTSLDRGTAFGRRNTVVLGENIEQFGKLAAASLKAGTAQDKVGLTYANNVLALQNQARALGLNKDQVDKLVTEVSKVPKGVDTRFATPGAAIAAGLAVTVKGKLEAIPKNVQTFVAQKNITPQFIQDLTNRLGRIPTKKDIEIALNRTGSDPERISEALNRLPTLKTVTVRVNGVATGIRAGKSIVGLAKGGVLNRPRFLPLAGEAGPEAIVPLRRPLAQVDKSVRALSAFAQGIPINGQQVQPMARGGVVGGGKSITFGDIIVSSNTSDPRATAHEVINYAVARAGIT